MATSNSPVNGPGRIQRGIQSRNDDLARLDQQGVKPFRVSGRVKVIGQGETSVTVKFPVTFNERPGFSYGSELPEFQDVSAGAFPRINCSIARWVTDARAPGTFNYIGAVVTVVVQGSLNYVWVHWHMDGHGFQNPIKNLNEADPLV